MQLERYDWYVDRHRYRPVLIADDLDAGEHSFELEVTHGDREECKGTNFALALIGVIPA